eukprot:14686675-Heterocapsa_arctica.AAC.1
MALLVFLENKLRAPEMAAEIVAQQDVEGEQPVTTRELHTAINMMKAMINGQMDINIKVARENLEEARRTNNMV